MAVPFSLLQENDFSWSSSNRTLAFRTTFRSTSSWSTREVLIFDIYHDKSVRTFVRDLKSAIHSGMTRHQLVKICMAKVRSALGAQFGAKTELEKPLHLQGVVARIGDYIHSKQGVCRHRAFLLLIALEAVGIRGAYIQRGTVRAGKETSRHAWVVWNKYTLDSMWNKDWVKSSLYKKSTEKRRIEFDPKSVPLGRCGPVWTGKSRIGNDTVDYLLLQNEHLRHKLDVMNSTLDVNPGWTFSSFFSYWLVALGIAAVVHLYVTKCKIDTDCKHVDSSVNVVGVGANIYDPSFEMNGPGFEFNEPGFEVGESDDESDDSDDESEEVW